MSAGGDKWRLFIALDLPEEVKSRLTTAQDGLRECLSHSAVSWTRRENLHLTLRFLGGVPAARTDALITALGVATRGFGPLMLTASGLGCFPDARRPRVLWCGIRDDTRQLGALARNVAAATAAFTSEPDDRDFAGHVTLGRVRRMDRRDAGEFSEFFKKNGPREFGTWTGRECQLVRSELNPVGSIYTRLAGFPLGAAVP